MFIFITWESVFQMSILPASQSDGMERKTGFTILSVSCFCVLFSCKDYVTDINNAILTQKKPPHNKPNSDGKSGTMGLFR